MARPTREQTRDVVILQNVEQNTDWIESLKDIRDSLQARVLELEAEKRAAWAEGDSDA